MSPFNNNNGNLIKSDDGVFTTKETRTIESYMHFKHALEVIEKHRGQSLRVQDKFALHSFSSSPHKCFVSYFMRYLIWPKRYSVTANGGL